MHQLFLPPTQLRNNLRSHLCNMRILRFPTPAISHWERQMDGTTFFNVISQRFPARNSSTWQSGHDPNMHNLSTPEAFKSPTTVDYNGFECKRLKHETRECTLSCSLTVNRTTENRSISLFYDPYLVSQIWANARFHHVKQWRAKPFAGFLF